MKPKSAMISSGRSALFEVHFQPDKKCEIYGIELDGYAFWGGESRNNSDDIDNIHQVTIPIPVSLRMIGMHY